MILAIANDNVTGGSNGDTLESFELAIAASPATKGLQERAFRGKYLYTIVSWIRDYNKALIIDGDATRKLELTLVRTLGTESRYDPAVHVEYLNSMVVPVADYHAICVAHRDVMRMF